MKHRRREEYDRLSGKMEERVLRSELTVGGWPHVLRTPFFVPLVGYGKGVKDSGRRTY
jgi:hypothetical protein